MSYLEERVRLLIALRKLRFDVDKHISDTSDLFISHEPTQLDYHML